MKNVKKFRVAWNGSKSVAVAAKKLGLKPRSASTMASALRCAGVKLKKFTGAK